jgi:hypothetical protein
MAWRDRLGVTWEVLERDYLISWVLAGIGRSEAIGDCLVFKGGTALKKCYFGTYRFSEDLDFTAMPEAPRGDELMTAVTTAARTTEGILDPYAPITINVERYQERDPHPGGQEAFIMRARLPWHTVASCRLMLEITMDEPILDEPMRREIIHGYEEPLEADVLVYSLEEILAEKLRSILQSASRMAERGWDRGRARDYYDLWRILGEYRSEIRPSRFRGLLSEKCAVRDVAYQDVDDFFPGPVVDQVAATWDQWLGILDREVPPFKEVAAGLLTVLRGLLE